MRVAYSLCVKNNCSFQFCIDFRKLDAVTVRDSYLILQMEGRIDSLGMGTVFSTLDANSGYWQIELEKTDMDKKQDSVRHT